MTARDVQIQQLAAKTAGIVTRTALRRLGCSDDQIRRRVRSGSLIVEHPGVFRLAGIAPTWIASLHAAIEAAGTSAMIDVLVPRGRHHRRVRGARVHESIDFDDRDRTTRRGLPVTSIERTLIDVAAVVPYERLEQHVDAAVRQGLTTFASVADRFVQLAGSGRVGTTNLRALLGARMGMDIAPGSPFEAMVLRLIRSARIDEPRLQHPVSVGDQRFLLDMAWPDRMVALECDGWQHHSTPGCLDADLRRQNLLVLAGWTVIRFAYRSVVERPELVARQIHSALRH